MHSFLSFFLWPTLGLANPLGCECSGEGPGESGSSRGLPVQYGIRCEAWDDGDCTGHECGSSQTCDVMYPDVVTGQWCCKPWCYVNALTCRAEDVGVGTHLDQNGSPLYYSYSSCENSTHQFTEQTCPWQTNSTWEQALGYVIAVEELTLLPGHLKAAGGVTTATVLRHESSNAELAITAAADRKICVLVLRNFGVSLSSCTEPLRTATTALAGMSSAAGTWLASGRRTSELALWSVGYNDSVTGCSFEKYDAYYLPGLNKEELVGTREECQAACCARTWCQSFDYAKSTGYGHDANICWLQSVQESSAIGLGLAYDSTGVYEFFAMKGTGKYTLKAAGVIANAHEGEVSVLEYADGIGLLSAGEDRVVKIWAVGMDGGGSLIVPTAPEATLGPSAWPATAMVRMTYGKDADGADVPAIGIAGEYSKVNVWVKEGGVWKIKQVLQGHSRMVRSLGYLATQTMLATTAEDSTVVYWTFARGTCSSPSGYDSNGKRCLSYYKPWDSCAHGCNSTVLPGGDQWVVATVLYDHESGVNAATWVTNIPLLATGDDKSLMLWRPVAENICSFHYTAGYYLAGFNRYVHHHLSVVDAQKLCCENPVCLSFDYSNRQGTGHINDQPCSNSNFCQGTTWISTAGEGKNGGAGLVYDSTIPSIFDYYEITKRGSRITALSAPSGISGLVFAPQSNLVVSWTLNSHTASAWKLGQVPCPSGQTGGASGTTCEPCQLGRAGTSGVCRACMPGTTANKEGLSQCIPCPVGWYNAGIGAKTCYRCSKGTFADNPGQSMCTPCGKGYYNTREAATRSTDCIPCARNFWSALETNGGSCMACATGTGHDLLGSSSANDCEHCWLCGSFTPFSTLREGAYDGELSKESCSVPRSIGCATCPIKETRTGDSNTACKHCSLGHFPSPGRGECVTFSVGSFSGYPDPQDAKCFAGIKAAEVTCPARIMESTEFSSAEEEWTANENQACARLHCMGAVVEIGGLYERQKAERCLVTLQPVCSTHLKLLNHAIAGRQTQINQAEEARDARLMRDQCESECKPSYCDEVCEKVTQSEQASETAFTVEAFTATKCSSTGSSCHVVCTSNLPKKSVIKNAVCPGSLPEIFGRRTRLPLCGAPCSKCSNELGGCRLPVVVPSSGLSTGGASGEGLSGWAIVPIVLSLIVV